ncbi:2-(3-amino-3-carboxypropyl)histidine synthase subunit 1 [Meloidogyne graminicola]|uniref:2-(3-amino-3-carboxypropyl)histidine synthase subunit 1 n=1 Tax=Meloidogyne graminicola TaxID=189291 RepID=A0A8T0A4Y2_9BILA|nr:2-(3-amino-3-carboxypropyl)histidine synthase subunit 1 [Meloidogyne graminicola]
MTNNLLTTRNKQRQEIEEIAQNPNLLKDLQILPSNYSFEIPKTIWKINSTQSKTVALQLPEGLTMFACLIADILEKYTNNCEFIILGDVTYGACCVDDYTAKALGCDLLVHYAHSCLVPIQHTVGIHLLYIFVNIDIQITHFFDTIKQHFESSKNSIKIALVSTIQFVASLQATKRQLEKEGFQVLIPQANPLSPGELLGCTSPKLSDDISVIIYLGDGRFHLESIMIHNPKIPAYQYNPYSHEFTVEKYGFEMLISNRQKAIEAAKNAKRIGLILGTLGRQGNIKIFEYLENQLISNGKQPVKILLSEIFGTILDKFTSIDCWVQVACPRLSIDWGHTFKFPLLTPYELSAAISNNFLTNEYPMDYYSNKSKGPWTNNHESYRQNNKKKIEHISIKNN